MRTILSSGRRDCVARVGMFLIALALIAGMVGCGQPTPPEEAVTFADPNLEAVVREAIAIPVDPMYPSDLDRLTSLNATKRISPTSLGWNM